MPTEQIYFENMMSEDIEPERANQRVKQIKLSDGRILVMPINEPTLVYKEIQKAKDAIN